MFGRVVEVILSNGSEKKAFRFNERKPDENARITFYTDHKYIKQNIIYGNIDLYNLDDAVLGWIWGAGTVIGMTEGFASKLSIELNVGYSNFEDKEPQMWNIFKGFVNSYYNSRKGRDNITHLLCANMPWRDISQNIFLEAKPMLQVSRRVLLEMRFMMLLANKGILQSYVPSLMRSFSSVEEQQKAVLASWTSKEFIIKIRNPLYENPNNDVAYQSSTNTDFLEQISGGATSMNKTPEYYAYSQWLSEIATSDPLVINGDFESWLRTFCVNEGAFYMGYNAAESKTTSYNGSPLTFVMDLVVTDIPGTLNSLLEKGKSSREGQLKKEPKTVIKNFEMLLEEPTLTSAGVEIKSLIRPWIIVNDVIELRVDDKPIINGQERSDEIWTANISGASNLYESVWGKDTAVFAAIKGRATKLSFLNEPLVVFQVQHSGDTHKKDWFSQINTYSPGLAFLRNQ